MDKKLVLTYLVTVAVLGAGAAGVLFWLKAPRPSEKIAESAPDPLFYKSMTTAERLVAARYRLDSMTRNDLAPSDIGPIKDEIALLAMDEAVVDLIVERFQACKDGGVAQLSAYMEIFARIRHKKFGALVAEGIVSEREASSINAIDAAIVQRDPKLVAFLARRLTAETGYRAQKIIEALASIGTTDALAACISAIEANDKYTKIWAMTSAASARWSDCTPAIAKQHENADPMVRTIAAFALARLGDPRGRVWLVAAAKDGTLPEDARAQALQNLLQVNAKESLPEIRDLIDANLPGVRRETRVALTVWRDPAMLKMLDADLSGADPAKRADAITVLARSGIDDDARRLEKAVDTLALDEVAALLQQLPQGGAPAGLDIYAKAIRRKDDLAVVGLRYVHRMGPKALDLLKTVATETKDEERLTFVLAAIASVGTKDAVEALMPYTHSPSRRIANWARQNVRLVEQELLKK